MACFTYKILILSSSLRGSIMFLDTCVLLDFSSHSLYHSEATSDVVLLNNRISGTLEPSISHDTACVILVCSNFWPQAEWIKWLHCA